MSDEMRRINFIGELTGPKILLVANDPEIAHNLSGVLDEIPKIRVERQDASLSQLNGTAVSMAQDHDVILFATDPKDESDLDAIRSLVANNDSDTIFFALTSGEISLTAARELNRAGVHDVLPIEIGSEDLAEQIEKWTKVHAPKHVEIVGMRTAKVIPVAQARGGIGSTSVAVNLAVSLARIGAGRKTPGTYRVALLDLDFQFGAVASFLDVEAQDGLLELAIGDKDPDLDFLRQCMVTMDDGLSVLTAPSRFAPIEVLNNTKIDKILSILASEFDFIVVDLPRALVDWVGPVMTRADHLFLVTDVSVPSVRQARRLIDIYTEDNLTLPVELVVNRAVKPMLPSGQQKAAEKVLERSFKYWLPEDIKAARSTLDLGKPLAEVAPRAKLTKAFRKMATATINLGAASPNSTLSKQGTS